MNTITINTDASFNQQYKVGGYAFSIVHDSFRLKRSGKFKIHPENSNYAEIMCIGNAMGALLNKTELPKVKWLVINTDSLNAIDWIKNSRCEISKKVFDLHKQLTTRIGSTNNHFRHVKGHSRNPDKRSRSNSWCDWEAKRQMREAVKEVKQNNI